MESGKPKPQLELKLVRNMESNTKDFCEYIGSRREPQEKRALCQMGRGTW